jgi:hypothetical protein
MKVKPPFRYTFWRVTSKHGHAELSNTHRPIARIDNGKMYSLVTESVDIIQSKFEKAMAECEENYKAACRKLEDWFNTDVLAEIEARKDKKD